MTAAGNDTGRTDGPLQRWHECRLCGNWSMDYRLFYAGACINIVECLIRRTR